MKADNFSRARHFHAGRLARVPDPPAPAQSWVAGRALRARRGGLRSRLLCFPAGFLLLCCLFAWVPDPVAAPAPSNPAAPAPPSWPIFRGNPALTGVAGDTLPRKPGLLWTFKTGGPVKSSAVIGSGKVFIGSDDGNLYALNFADGRQVWAFKAAAAMQAPPLLVNNSLFAGSVDGLFYALDAGAGSLLWKVQTDGKILASASVVPRRDGPARILFGSYDFKLRCLDAEKGATNWLFESGNYINGACAVAGGRAVFGGCDSMVHVLQVEDGKEISQIEAGAFIGASVALAGNRAYFGEFDPFGDYDLIFGAAKQNRKIVDMPIRYQERTYGTTNIDRWRHGVLLLQMVMVAAFRLKFV